jgi:hypothetical protein
MANVSKEVRVAFQARREMQQSRELTSVLRYRAEEFAKLQGALVEVSNLSGGWADFLETPTQAQAIYSRILADINERYIVGFYPANKSHDGKRHNFKVEIKGHPDYTIVGRKFYYAL